MFATSTIGNLATMHLKRGAVLQSSIICQRSRVSLHNKLPRRLPPKFGPGLELQPTTESKASLSIAPLYPPFSTDASPSIGSHSHFSISPNTVLLNMDSVSYLKPLRSARKRKTTTYYEDKTEDSPDDCQPPPKKAKKPQSASEDVNPTTEGPQKTPKKKASRAEDAPIEEKRQRRFRARPPQSYLDVKQRALTQRLTVLSRERCGTDDAPEEKVVIAGSTGNVYTVHIGFLPRCDCPHANKGNQCKHVIYVMLRVLKAQEKIAYQLALTSSELREVFKHAPPIPGVETDNKDASGEQDGNRKPVEGECPICYDELESGKDAIVYCKASCGNNIHKNCMQKWISMARGKATCPYCRAKWMDDELPGNIGDVDVKNLQRNKDGYLNVAEQLGLSGERDYSTYYHFWVRRHLGTDNRRRGHGDD